MDERELSHLKPPERAVAVFGSDMRLIAANEAAEKFFGGSLDALLGKTGDELIDMLVAKCAEEDRVGLSSLKNSYCKPERLCEDVVELQSPTYRILHRHSTPVFGEMGKLAGKIEVYSDITKRRELEREVVRRSEDLARLNKELQAARQQLVLAEKFRSLGEMAAGVAHDLNNVLGVTLANAQLLLRTEITEEQRERLEAIQMAALDGAETVRRIRELVQDRPQPKKETVSLNEIVADVVKVTEPSWKTEPSARGSDINIEVVAGEVSPVMGNPSELRELLANILLNSVQAMPNGGKITIQTYSSGNSAVLSLSDTGTGMSDEVKRRAFDPFFTTRGPEGTGLGLSIAYTIAKRHGGEISLESEEGKGTTVTVKIPFVSTNLTAQPCRAEEPAPQPSAKIMVVDDEEAYAKALGAMAAEMGHQAKTCSNPERVLDELADGSFDLLIVDLAMPKINGLDLAKSIREKMPSLPIMLLTGWADFLRKEEAEESGVSIVLAKPVSYDDLQRSINKLLDR